MNQDKASELMKRAWDERASRNAGHYVETAHFDGDFDKFFALGEERARLLIDPVLERYNVARGEVLDLGCGLGRFARALRKRFLFVRGVDISPEMIRRAESLHADPHDDYDWVSFRAVEDGQIYPWGESHDFVWSYECWQHMPTRGVQLANLKEIARVLKPDGIGLIHFRCAHDTLRSAIAHDIARFVPTKMLALAKRLAGRDHRTADHAWRGAPPIPSGEFRYLAQQAGLVVLEFRDDPTHAVGSRLFAVVRRAE